MPGLASVRPASDTEIKTRSHSSSRAFSVSPLLAGDFGKRVTLTLTLTLTLSSAPRLASRVMPWVHLLAPHRKSTMGAAACGAGSSPG